MQADRFDVRAFGAQGDFVSDDTAALQAAIDAAREGTQRPGGRRVVYLPGGDYLTGPLSLGAGVTLAGDGTGVTRLFSRDAGQTTLLLEGIAENVPSVHVRGLALFANGQGGTGLSLNGADAARRVIDVRVEDCQFSLFERAVHLRLCSNVWLEQVHAAACVTGIAVDTSCDVKMNHCFCDNGAGWGFDIADDGAHGASGEGVYLTGCTTNAQAGGLRVRNQSWGQALGCSFTSCAGIAVLLDGAGNWRVGQGEVATAAEGAAGIVLSPESRKCLVEGNYVSLCEGALVVAGTDHVVAGNLLDAGLGAAPDIELLGLACKVSGNKCLSTANPDAIVERGEANFNFITGNMVQGRITRAGAGSMVAPDQFYY